MTLKKFLSLSILALFICLPKVEAADKPMIMIVDIGQFEDSSIGRKNKNLSNQDNEHLSDIRSMIPDYMIASFADSSFSVFDNEFLFDDLLSGEKNFEMKSTAPLARMKEIAEHFNIDYVVYGDFQNLYGKSVIMKPKFRNDKFHSLTAEITAQIMDVKNNRIIATATGEGVSKVLESEQKYFGKNEVLIISLHNAIQKAAIDATQKLMKAFPES